MHSGNQTVARPACEGSCRQHRSLTSMVYSRSQPVHACRCSALPADCQSASAHLDGSQDRVLTVIMSQTGHRSHKTNATSHNSQSEPPEADEDYYAGATKPKDELPTSCCPLVRDHSFLGGGKLPKTARREHGCNSASRCFAHGRKHDHAAHTCSWRVAAVLKSKDRPAR